MAIIKRALIKIGPLETGFRAGYAYDTETKIVSHIGGINNGTGTAWARITHIPSGQSRQHTWQPQEGEFVANIVAFGIQVERIDWDSEGAPFSIEASYTP